MASIQSVDIDLFSLFANYSYSEINSVTVRYSDLDGDAKDGTNTYNIDANKLSLAHNSALSDDLALVLEYSMEESDHTTDQDTFAVELLYAFQKAIYRINPFKNPPAIAGGFFSYNLSNLPCQNPTNGSFIS